MSSGHYDRLNTDEDAEEAPAHVPSYKDDPRFYEAPVAAWKRVALILFLVVLGYAGYQLRAAGAAKNNEPIIVHADR